MELELIDGNPVISHVVRFKDRTTINEIDAGAVRDGAVIVWVVRTVCEPPSYHPIKKDSDDRYRFNIQDVKAAAVLHGDLREGALAYLDDPTQTQGRLVFDHPTYNGGNLVEIGGQVMTQAQYDAARAPLLEPVDPTVFVETGTAWLGPTPLPDLPATAYPPSAIDLEVDLLDDEPYRVSVYGPAGSDAQRLLQKWDEL